MKQIQLVPVAVEISEDMLTKVRKLLPCPLIDGTDLVGSVLTLGAEVGRSEIHGVAWHELRVDCDKDLGESQVELHCFWPGVKVPASWSSDGVTQVVGHVTR